MTDNQSREIEQYKPGKKYQQLKHIFSSKQKCSLDDFIDYCFYVVGDLQKNKYQKINKKQMEDIVTKNVIPTYMPCLIYQHLLQTIASIVEAYDTKDTQLIEIQVKEVKKSVVSYMTRKELGPHRQYQSYYSLQITQNIYDLNLKQNFYNETMQLIDQFKKIIQQEGNKKSKKSKKQKNNKNLEKIKQKREKMKERQKKVQGMLQKLTNKKNKIQQVITDENQEKYFVLLKGIQMNLGIQDKN